MPRPSFKATRDQRKLVKSMAALGLRQEQIATTIGLRSPKTLRKHFRQEITRGSAEANAAVTRVAFEMATSGKWPVMTRYWMNVMAASPEPPLRPDDDDYDSPEWSQ